MSHGDVAQYANVLRRVGLVLLALTSLIVVAGIATAAYRGTLLRPSIGWGAITLTIMLSFFWYSLLRQAMNIAWLALPLLTLSASLWLMAVAG